MEIKRHNLKTFKIKCLGVNWAKHWGIIRIETDQWKRVQKTKQNKNWSIQEQATDFDKGGIQYNGGKIIKIIFLNRYS